MISIVIPVFNEEKNIEELHRRIISILENRKFEIIFVNDGSIDASQSIIERLCIENTSTYFIQLSRNFGHQLALWAGYENATGDLIISMDSDLQHPPEVILDLIIKQEATGKQIVIAERSNRDGESFFKKAFSKIFYKIFKNSAGFELSTNAADFRLITKSVLRNLLSMPEKQKFIRGQMAWLGFEAEKVTYEGQKRIHGRSSYSLRKMVKLAFDGITGFSNLPLKLATFLGFGASIIAFILILQAIYARFFTENYQPGWASVVISVLFIGGVQLICLGIIGEYISRINENTRNRPMYIVKSQKINID